MDTNIMGWEVIENTIKNYTEKCGFGKPDVVADKMVDHEFDYLLQELWSDATVEEFLEFDGYVDICEPVMNTFTTLWTENRDCDAAIF